MSDCRPNSLKKKIYRLKKKFCFHLLSFMLGKYRLVWCDNTKVNYNILDVGVVYYICVTQCGR